MATIIPRNIDESELIIRFAFQGDYRRNRPYIEDNLNGRELFFDKRDPLFSVSVVRKMYLKSDDCVAKGNSIQPNLKSLVVFRKKDFDEAVRKNLEARANFDAKIIGTPLDEKNNYFAPYVEVTTETLGTPSHGDIIILNPSIIDADDNNANTAIRSFSSILYKHCKVITLNDENEITDEIFEKIYKTK